jgi:hypothetical protein
VAQLWQKLHGDTVLSVVVLIAATCYALLAVSVFRTEFARNRGFWVALLVAVFWLPAVILLLRSRPPPAGGDDDANIAR